VLRSHNSARPRRHRTRTAPTHTALMSETERLQSEITCDERLAFGCWLFGSLLTLQKSALQARMRRVGPMLGERRLAAGEGSKTVFSGLLAVRGMGSLCQSK
jgi:hypothetical protein